MNENKNYHVKDIQKASDVDKNPDTRIVGNVVFAAASLVLAGVAFGLPALFASTTLQYLVAFGCVGVTNYNLKEMREKLRIRSGKNKETTQGRGK